MKAILKFIGFCFLIAALVTGCLKVTHSQSSSAPPYLGALDNKVSIPMSYKGQNWKLTGDRLSASGSGNNFANANLTLDSNRTHNLSGKTLTYLNGLAFNIQAATVKLTGVGSQTVTIRTDSTTGNHTIYFNNRNGSIPINSPGVPTLSLTSGTGISYSLAAGSTDDYGLIELTNTASLQDVILNVSYSQPYNLISIPVLSWGLPSELVGVQDAGTGDFNIIVSNMVIGPALKIFYQVKGK